jgi:gliding motility-associated lipoprotein GldH
MRNWVLYCVVVGSGLLAGCDSTRVFEKNENLPDRIWRVDDVKTFDFEITDTLSAYNLYYNVRNARNYPYSRIFVTYTLGDTLGNVADTRLVYDQLFSQKTGKPLGQSGIGDAYFNSFPFLENFTFAAPGVYRVTLQQYNRMDELPEVLAVGLRVERATQLE